ncbi:rhomboid family intramembrane serine protease [Mucilaginibacter gynuensis]|uniref:Rhomboid family intramembrane serine protease n=1 Tax=Mucilaginibacter gynuensis TaxID=1302236 RepID=A0ABP8H0C6_9SPHI
MIEYLQMAPVAALIFIITIITSLMVFSNETLYGKFMLHPYSVSRKQYIYTIFTSGLIHKDWMHLIFNMMSYYFFAFMLEATIGHWQFGLLYIATLVLSDLPTIYKQRDNYGYHSLGASGAISGVIFGFILYYPKSQMGILFIPFPIPAYIFGGLYLLYCTYASKHSHDAINHDAHLYGALSGLLITIALNPDVIAICLSQFGIRL